MMPVKRGRRTKEMNSKELHVFFRTHLVPSRLYRIGRPRTGRLCMTRTKSGFWEVFFGEKKNKVGLMQFATENEACQRMMEEMCKIMEQLYGITWRSRA